MLAAGPRGLHGERTGGGSLEPLAQSFAEPHPDPITQPIAQPFA